MDIERFKKVCGLLGSDQMGERAAAALRATAMLNQGGHSWSAISIGSARPSEPDSMPLVNYWRMMLDDERARNKRLSSELDKLKRLAKTLELKLAEQATGVPVAEQRKAERAEKKAFKEELLKEQQRLAEERAANAKENPRAEMPIDAELRSQIAEALGRELPDRTREFLASVQDQRGWTFKQRAAIQKTLRWVFRE